MEDFKNNISMVTVVMAVYNSSGTLARAIESVINQSYNDWLMICVDDGSMDNSLEILNNYAQNDQRITVLSQKNGGPAAARAAAYQIVQTPYVTFLDSDDLFSSDFLSSMMDCANRTNADTIIPNVLCEHPDGSFMNWNIAYGISEGTETTGEECFGKTFIQPTIHGINMWKTDLIKRFALNKNATYNNMNADEYIQRLLLLNSSKVAFSGGTYYYKCNMQSITKGFTIRQLGYLETCLKFIDLIEEYHLTEPVSSIIKEYYFRHIIHLQIRLYKDGNSLSKKDYETMRSTIKEAYFQAMAYKGDFHFKEKRYPLFYKATSTSGYLLFCLTCYLFAKYKKCNG